ncbi:hypothetical protein NDU88_002380 [Pleurodeles waltl]|uniref:Uncharacterized protein n=1 Tax=Pleurodeles waltl TaxID=8319 RepID=A0AAV7KSI8_PLEWA|nr:hypothetical protein NDU88_002380 [Pleurodeles waltl]
MGGCAAMVRRLSFVPLEFVQRCRGLGTVILRAVSTRDPRQVGVVGTAAWAFRGPYCGYLGWTVDLHCPGGDTSYHLSVEVRWGGIGKPRHRGDTQWSNILHLCRFHSDRLIWEGLERHWRCRPQRRSPHVLNC